MPGGSLRERLRSAGTAQFIGPAAERVTFEELSEAYLSDYRVNARSLRDAERAVTWLHKTFAFNRAIDITADRINAYIEARLADKAARATINRELAALRRMLTLAMRAGKLPSRPHIAMLEENNARGGFFEAAEFEEVCKHLPEELADFATFAYLTGWRKGEIQKLQWAEVDMAGQVIRLRAANSKNKRGRVLMLRSELLALIQRRHESRRLECPYVFNRKGEPIGDFRKSWGNACEAAGVGVRLFHDLRRTAAQAD